MGTRDDIFNGAFGWSDGTWWALLAAGIFVTLLSLCCCCYCLQRARRKGREEAFKIVQQQREQQQRQRRLKNQRGSQVQNTSRQDPSNYQRYSQNQSQYHATRETYNYSKNPGNQGTGPQVNGENDPSQKQKERMFARMAPTTAALLQQQWADKNRGAVGETPKKQESLPLSENPSERLGKYSQNLNSRRATSYHEWRKAERDLQPAGLWTDGIGPDYAEVLCDDEQVNRYNNSTKRHYMNDYRNSSRRNSDPSASYEAWRCECARLGQANEFEADYDGNEQAMTSTTKLRTEELQHFIDIDIDASFMSRRDSYTIGTYISKPLTPAVQSTLQIEPPILSDRISELRGGRTSQYANDRRSLGTDESDMDSMESILLDQEAQDTIVTCETWQKSEAFFKGVVTKKMRRPLSPLSSASSCLDTESCTTLTSKKSSDIDDREFKFFGLRKYEENLSVISALTEGQFDDADTFLMVKTPKGNKNQTLTRKNSIYNQDYQIIKRSSDVPSSPHLASDFTGSPTCRQSFEV
uniref:AlNc14C150G7495 protein n=1 Tax=Albugo laibachii Nc14 TaxID=890382 RepID=F0WLY2_9STRA|nr:AlNc14C150G7495 [Albugo laibachii Nc14]|eukprot:CCA22309.1 AlNc14C150G7495 [Albugo laibachii Nc14]